MSTAGKVLVVLVMLASLLWVVLTAGVTQLNRNGNQALLVLSERAAKLEEDVQNTRHDVALVKDQTTLMQEKLDRDMAVVNAHQADAQRMASSIREILSRVQYELAEVQHTLQESDKDRTIRAEEKVNEEKMLAQARDEVEKLKATDRELTERLVALREQFAKVLGSNKASIANIRDR